MAINRRIHGSPQWGVTPSAAASRPERSRADSIEGDVDAFKARLLCEGALVQVRFCAPHALAACLELADEGHGWFTWYGRTRGRVFQASRDIVDALRPDCHLHPEQVPAGEPNADDYDAADRGGTAKRWRDVLAAAVQIVQERAQQRERTDGPPRPPEAAAAAVVGEDWYARKQRLAARREKLRQQQEKASEEAA